MLNKIFDRFFPCEQRLREIRADHAEAVRENGKTCLDLRIACGASFPSDFSHLSGDCKHVVNPR